MTDRPNAWVADYAGDLSINGDDYDVEGLLEGRFAGTRANPTNGQSPIRAITAVDEGGFAVVNGALEEVPVSIELIGENG